MDLEFKVFNTFLLKSLIFFPTPKYYLCFVLYYFRRLCIINIKESQIKKVPKDRVRLV